MVTHGKIVTWFKLEKIKFIAWVFIMSFMLEILKINV